ncbi:MAG: hypothetical protein ACK4HW_10020 [Roseinatronobacter sp.]
MPNAIAYLALLIWPFVIVAMFRKMPIERAFIWAIVGGYMFLPERTEFNFPMIPAFTKETIPNLTVLVVCVVLLKMRPALLPQGLLGKALFVLLITTPMVSVVFNLDPITFATHYSGRLVFVKEPIAPVPGMRVYDALSALISQLFFILPFFLARKILASEAALTELLRALMFAGLIYSAPILWEVRFSPQLHTDIYGFFQHDFHQMMREGGFRPIVFMPHGLWVALFMVMTAISALHFAKQAAPNDRLKAVGVTLWLFFIVILCKSLGPLMFLFALTAGVLFLGPKMQLRAGAAMAAITIAYPAMRGAGLIPTDWLVAWLEARKPDRAQSLWYRFYNEDMLLDRAAERPVFGWGGWGRNQVYDMQSGEAISVTDGQWIITIGSYGWIGYIALFGLLCLPLIALWWRYRSAPAAQIPPQVGVLVLMHGAGLIDLLPNATMVTLTWLMAGALLGHAELVHRRTQLVRLEGLRSAPHRAGLLGTARTREPVLNRSIL